MTGAPAAVRAVLLELGKTGSVAWVVGGPGSCDRMPRAQGNVALEVRLWSCAILMPYIVASLSLAFILRGVQLLIPH